jgi:hypothetical protein
MSPFRFDDARLGRLIALPNQFAACRAPGLGSPIDACHVFEPALNQELRCPDRTETTLANHQYRAIARNFIESGGQIGLGQLDGARNVAADELLRCRLIVAGASKRSRAPRNLR